MHLMASAENSHSPPINRLVTGTSPIVKHTESSTQLPSSPTIIPMTSKLSPSTSSVRSSKKKRPSNNDFEFSHVSSRKKRSVNQISKLNLRHRLYVKEYFYTRLALVSNMMCLLAVFGIVLMVIETELTFNRVDNKDTEVSWFIKLIITITTVILLTLILYYHHLDMALYSFRNSLDDWRVELTNTKILLITVEILICAIHPMPRSYPQSDPEKINSNSSSSNPHSLSYTAVDVGLGLPMFLRLYLCGRSIMLHLELFRNISLRSFGYLNQVPIDLFFVTKTYLEKWPTLCLATFCTIFFFIGSWSLRACDYTTTGEHLSISNAMWLFIITFTTIGYGDQYPSTYYGRCIAAIIGLVGLLLSALLIAILSKKLHLTREEKYVHTFVLNFQLAKNRRNQAANVIKFSIKAWYLKRHDKGTSMQHFAAQRKLFRSIHYLQQMKQERRNLVDNCVGFTELITMQRNSSVQSEETIEQIVAIKTDVKKIEENVNHISRRMDTLQNTLNVLLDEVRK